MHVNLYRMKLSQWRPSFEAWVSGLVKVDSWLLQRPDVGKVNGFIPPFKSLQIDSGGANSPYGLGKGVQGLMLSTRFAATNGYHTLALPVLEGLYQTLSLRITHDYQQIHPDIQGLSTRVVEQPITLEEVGDNLGDWIVTLEWEFAVSWYADQEASSYLQPGVNTDELTKPLDVHRLIGTVYRQKLTGPSTADMSLDLTQ